MGERFRFEPETNVQKALQAGDQVPPAFKRLGLKCVDKAGEMCVAAEVETLADAARYHGIRLETLLDELNRLGVGPGP